MKAVFLLLGAFWGIIVLGCILADYVFPHIPFLERMINNLPLMRDEPAAGGRKDYQ